MRFNVAQLLKESVGSSREYEIEEEVEGSGPRPEKVRGSVSFLRTNRGILVSGSLKRGITCACSRCLVQFTQDLHLKIEEEYLPTIDIFSGLLIPIAEDEAESFTIDEHHILDLSEAVRQYTMLNLPMKPLCHQGCEGFCPRCGANLNLGLCRCSKVTLDPRWSPLKGLALVQKVDREK